MTGRFVLGAVSIGFAAGYLEGYRLAVFAAVFLWTAAMPWKGGGAPRLTWEAALFYAFVANMLCGGKNFAYVGVAPLYVTDLTLVLLACGLAVRWSLRPRLAVPNAAVPYLFLLTFLSAWGARSLVIHYDSGLDAFRDSVPIVYMAWGVFAYLLLREEGHWAWGARILVASGTFAAFGYLATFGEFIILKRLPGFEGFRFGAGTILPSLGIFLLLASRRRIGIGGAAWGAVLALANLTLFHRSVYLGLAAGYAILAFCLRGAERARALKAGALGLGVALVMGVSAYSALGIETASLQRYVARKFTGQDGNVGYRTSGWTIGMDKFLENPWGGVGVGTPLMFEKENRFYTSSGMGYSEIRDSGGNAQIHNSPLNFFVRYGIVGGSAFVLVFALLYLNLVLKRKRDPRGAAFAAATLTYLLIYSCFNVVLEGPHEGSLFWAGTGMAMAVAHYRREEGAVDNGCRTAVPDG